MRNIVLTLLFFFVLQIEAQRIRKDQREMTPAEKTAYVSALNSLKNDGLLFGPLDIDNNSTTFNVETFAGHHGNHFDTTIHNGEEFTSWHRIFQMDFENHLKDKNAFLTVPYWDWLAENTASNISWDDANFLSQTLLTSWGLPNRNSMNGTLAFTTSPYSIPSVLANTTYNALNGAVIGFRRSIELGYHNSGHGFIGGIMGSTTSPADPMFFLHHGNVDRIWQEWEDQENAIKSTYVATTSVHWTNINPNNITDSRYTQFYDEANNGPIITTDVWFAKNKKLVLDGLNGNFVTGSNPKLYCYVAWNGTTVDGEIYAGDLKRDASDNIITDNKGGFVVSSGSNCEFKTAKAIILKPGFSSLVGSNFSASIVTTACGFATNMRQGNDNFVSNIKYFDNYNLTIYPNPSNGIFKIKINKVINGVINVTDLFGYPIYKSSFENQSEFEMNMQDKPRGIYIVKVISGDEIFTGKIIKN